MMERCAAWPRGDLMWQIEYEQGPLEDARFYKFDHEPITDRHWHPLHQRSRARYRICDGALQYVCAENDEASQTLVAVLELISSTTPLQMSDVVEVLITRRPDGFNIWAATEIDKPDGVTVPHLTRLSLEGAIRMLRGGEDVRQTRIDPHTRDAHAG